MFKFIKKLIISIKYDWGYLKVLNSPFVGLRLKWYFGEIRHGTPYFLPRKWVKPTKEDCESYLEEDIKRCSPKYVEGRTWEYYKNHKKPVKIKYFGWDSCSLGWKTKWDDFRFEWNPMYSLVIFGKQLHVVVVPNLSDDMVKWDAYWEAWLNYEYDTDKTKSKKERLQELFKNHSCTWISYEDKVETKTDYYQFILKKKYLKNYIKDE